MHSDAHPTLYSDTHSDRTPPALITAALEGIWSGTQADFFESEMLDFKEDPQHHQNFKTYQRQHKKPKDELKKILTNAAVCMANGRAGRGYLVLGVNDKTPGPEAFTGTAQDPEWVTDIIASNTDPKLSVHVYPFDYQGKRLLIIEIPQAFTLYENLREHTTYRDGARCLPMTREKRQSIIAQRANPDFTARTVDFGVQDIKLEYLSFAQELIAQKNTRLGSQAPYFTTPLDLLRYLGLLDESGDGTRLLYAAQLLFGESNQANIRLRHITRQSIGGQVREITEYHQPLVVMVRQVQLLVQGQAQTQIASVHYADGIEGAIYNLPDMALDEAVTNAIAHRDWSDPRPIVIEQTPRSFKIISPGGLPAGITLDNLLTTKSHPRNPKLMSAMRLLGMVEETSQGFDRMWSALLATGCEAPAVEVGADVEVSFYSGKPDTDFVRFVHSLGKRFGSAEVFSAFALIVLRHLWLNPVLTLRDVKSATQMKALEARQYMEQLCATHGIVEQVGEEEWRLSAEVQALREESLRVVAGREGIELRGQGAARHLGVGAGSAGSVGGTAQGANQGAGQSASQGAGQGIGHGAAQGVESVILARLREQGAVIARDIANECGVDRLYVTDMLRRLREQGVVRIDPAGPQRGPTVKWIAAKATKKSTRKRTAKKNTKK